jgi:hypothetical protein
MRRPQAPGQRRRRRRLDAGTLQIEPTRIVVDGQVIESDGKTQNAQHTLALDPFMLAVLNAHVEMIDQERRDFGPDYDDHGVLFCWETASLRTRTQSPADSRSSPEPPTCQRSTCTTCATATRPRAVTPKSTGGH